MIKDVLSYPNAAVFKTEKTLRASLFFPLLSIAILAVLISVFFPLIWHYNFNVSLYRGALLLFIATPLSLFVSMKSIGTAALCLSTRNGVIFNCAENLETKNYKGILKSSTKLVLDHPLIINSTIEESTFKNMVAHIIFWSNQKFATELKNYLDYKVDKSLISDCNTFEDIGLICKINGIQIFFGYPEFIKKLGLGDNELEPNKLYLYMSSRYVGDIEIPEINVSDAIIDSTDRISKSMGNIAKQNALIAFIIKALLITLSISGLMKLWIIILVETVFEIVQLFNVNKIK